MARSLRLAVATLVVAAAGLVGVALPAGPASAGTCATASGVTVLVDFRQLGGGVQGTCIADGGGQRASSLFPEAGFPITYVQGEPGFVCRVSGVPTAADEPCTATPPDTAYWGLWWSDGTSGTWTYSNYGVSALKLPDGAYVAFAWKSGAGSAPAPGVAPAPHAAAPSASTAPSSGGSATPTGKPTSKPTPKPTPTSKPTPKPTSKPTSKPSTGPSTGSTGTPSASAVSATASTSGSSSVSSGATATATGSAGSGPSSGETSPGAGPSTGGPASGAASASTSGPGATVSADASDGVVVSDPRPPTAGSSGPAGLPAWVLVLVVLGLFAAAAAGVVLRRRGRSAG